MSLQHYRQSLPSGFQLYWYRIERVLGQGGFGITYFACDTNLDRPVAIKEYLPIDIARRGDNGAVEPRTSDDGELYRRGMARFLTEAKTLNRFDHPNIVRVYSVFEANNTAYMVMRYEEGEALNDVLERVKTLPQAQLLDIVKPLLDGLEQIHAAGYIHRDVQPANIYLRRDGSPVLLDFGAARESSSGARTMTILVAPGYAPIEQYYSHGEQQGPWTDIYGLGASLYRAVAGVPPIDAIERSRGILGSTRDVLMPALIAGHGRYDLRLLQAIDHALMFNEMDRPQSAAAWLRELEGLDEPATEATVAPPADVAEASIDDPEPKATAPLPSAPGRPARARRSLALPMLATGATFALFALGWWQWQSPSSAWLGAVLAPSPSAAPLAQRSPEPVDAQIAQLTAATQRIAALEAEVRKLTEQGQTEAAPPQAPVTPPAPLPASSVSERGVASPPAARQAPGGAALKPEVAVAAPAEPKAVTPPMPTRRSTDAAASSATPGAAVITPVAMTRVASDEAPVRAPAVAAVVEHPAPTKAASPPATPGNAAVTRARELLATSDYGAARTLLQQAANSGDAQAQYLLGNLLDDERVGQPDHGAALDWHLKSARQGWRDAQVAVARTYARERSGTQRDAFLAYTWFVLAEQNGAFDVARERDQTSRLLQPEQLPQALALATALRAAGRTP